LWTKQLEALLPSPWKTNTLRDLGLVQGAFAAATSKKAKAAPWEDPEEHPVDGEVEDEEEGEGHQDDGFGVEDIGGVDDNDVGVDVGRDGDAGNC